MTYPQQPQKISSISAYHQVHKLPPPAHPLISVIDIEQIRREAGAPPLNMTLDFYTIGLKRDFNGKLKYGQQQYDFDGGILTFMAPGQVLRIEVNPGERIKHAGWLLVIHPDFFWNTPLARSIRQYEFFDYAVHEALFLSEREEAIVEEIMMRIIGEYTQNMDAFSQNVIIAQIELLLTYAGRFYHRQFLTRKISNHQVLDRLEAILDACFTPENLAGQGIPTVQFIAAELHVSPNYLSGLLKVLTGQSTQQHVHDRLIARAKEMLSTTGLTVSEIAYALGFEHPQSFSKLFRTKTQLSPLAFRQSFN
ncbi:MAG: helix-turn-helix transcriptional regulator [Mucilaginibacter polytrichastri]|nr:helix-turn-helix transcriptional regulator [Mucilaginibacter polytrichastri]